MSHDLGRPAHYALRTQSAPLSPGRCSPRPATRARGAGGDRQRKDPAGELDAVPIDHFRAVDPNFEHQPLRVDEQVAFSALHLFAAIVAAPFSAYPGRLHRLAVRYAGAGLRVPLQANPHALAHGGVHPLPATPSRRQERK